jgi:hypothetical protein
MTIGTKALTKIATMAQADFDTAGTFAAGTGDLLPVDALGVVDLGVTVDLGEDLTVGRRTTVQSGRVAITGKNPVVTIGESPASLRTLPYTLWSLGATKTGASAPYTYTWSPAQTSLDTLVYQSLLATDGIQKYQVTGAVPTEFTIGADATALMTHGVTMAAKSIATSSATFPTNIEAQPTLSGRLLKLSVDTDFPVKAGTGATDYDHLMSFTLSVTTGASVINALDGTLVAATAGLTGALDATLTLTVMSNAAAIANGGWGIDEISEQRFLRIYGTTADNYGVWILGSWVIESVTPIAADAEGVVTNEVTLRLALDPVSGKSLEIIVDSPLAAVEVTA